MFTGIITDIGIITSISEKENGRKLAISCSYDSKSIALGASIACSGACLTVVEKDDGKFTVEVSDETLSCTTLSNWQKGTRVNLERALKVGDELGGHIVTGHVDGIAEIEGIQQVGDNLEVTVAVQDSLTKFIAAKGSVTIDGVSLTVNKVEGSIFYINIIPHTIDNTIFNTYEYGSKVNLEVDILARYVESISHYK